MTPSRQKQLIAEFVAQLPPLPYQCPRGTQVDNLQHSQARDQRVHLAPSTVLPTLAAVYLAPEAPRVPARGRILDYTGWILSTQEYQQFGYAVHTAVHLSRLFGADKGDYVLVGDPTRPAAQINCVTGTDKRPNVQLTVRPTEMKWRFAAQSSPVAGAAAEAAHHQTALVTDSYITVRAIKPLRPGDELWIDYGREYWEHMSLYCPHCLEYGADAEDHMLICEAPGCKRAWHQLCWSPCLVDVPEGSFYCDIHSKAKLH